MLHVQSAKILILTINEQASNAGVSRQCLEDKMSKRARNVDIKRRLW
jgi:hypothetical protein